MSDYLADGQERTLKTCRLRLKMNLVQQYEELEAEKPTFSYLLNTLLADWLVNQQLKSEFERLNKITSH